MKRLAASLAWLAVALLGAWAYAILAFNRGEPINSAFILVAALCSYAIGFRFYSKWIAARVLALNDRRATPCEVNDDGKDFVRTNKWIVFGHHFAAIAGPGPLVGPVLAAQFGYLPGTLWLLIGVVLGGAVQDFVILFCSMRRAGKSLGQMVKDELNTTAGVMALLAILSILVILLAVLALVVVKALANSPWGVFTVGATIPIAMLMGTYLRFWRVGKVREASAIGVGLLLAAVWGGKCVHSHPAWAHLFTIAALPLAWSVILYGLAASVLPVWLLLAPRDYLSTFMKLGTIFALALGIFLVLPDLKMHAVSRFVDGTGPVLAGKLFPFCFITIACGAVSGFHSLIASGTTPKLITRESYARSIGYGAMCLESLVAIMALIAACTLDPGVYFSMNVKGPPAATVAHLSALGFPVTVDQMNRLAAGVGERTLFGRTGGAATLAVGMAGIFSKAVSGRWLDLWYHFAIMFEALFILTTLDAGTRVGRYLLQDCLGQLWKPLGQTRRLEANLVASALMVAAWGWFLVQGVRDPLGGINSLWPLFGIANQLLATVALCLATTVILKMQLQAQPATQQPDASKPGATLLATPPPSTLNPQPTRLSRPALAWVTVLPLVWLLTVTMTAGLEKIDSPDPRLGFLAAARALDAQLPTLQRWVATARATGAAATIAAAQAAVTTNRNLRFNQVLDAGVAGLFLALVGAVVLLSVREWILLLARKRLATLRESDPVWLPEYALRRERPLGAFGLLALVVALGKELSGEAQMEQEHRAVSICHGAPANFAEAGLAAPARPGRKADRAAVRVYLAVTSRRFDGVTRCC